jgi:Mlc titration factor MtfA (ptsG expression regulator)
MEANRFDIGPAKAGVVDLTLYSDVRYWAKELKCTANQLRDAVKAVGNSAAVVRQYLATH